MCYKELKEMVPPLRENTVAVSNEITLPIPYYICSRLVILLEVTDALHHSLIFYLLKKLKWFHYRAGVAQRVGSGIALIFHDHGTWRAECSASRLGRTLPPGKTRYPFYRKLGGPQGRSGRAENTVPTGIRSRTFQPVVSRYADWATRPTFLSFINSNTWIGVIN